MNKLVSKNPVLRFKLGKKILKMQYGGGTYYEVTERPKINTSKAKKESLRQYNRIVYNGKWTWGKFDNNGNFSPITKLVTLNNGTILNLNGTKSSTNVRNVVNNPKLIERGYIDSKGIKHPIQDKKAIFVKRQSSTPRSGWSYGFDRSKEGIGDIATMLRKLKAEGYYADDENSTDDGKWGQSTENAYKRYLAKLKAMELPQEVVKPVVSAITVQTPNFGYRTSNTYQDADFYDRLKAMGIKSNADLIDFMHKTNGADYNWNGDNWARQFRSDVNQALGGDYSDANIRKTFHTKNGWGGGFLGGGDFTDFQNALQTNAGVWNGSYERNLGNYVKNIDWSKFKLYKQGGQLISRNPIKRFKLKKFLVGGPVTTLKTGGEIPKLKTAWLPINWNDNNKFVDKVVENVSNGMKDALKRVENYRKANKVANRNTRTPLINNTAKLLQALYDKGFYNGVIDKRRTGKQVTLERAVDGYEGDMTNQAILNAINAGYTINKNTGEIKPPRKLAYGKTPKKLPQQLQQASTFSFDKLKSLGKEFYGRVFGDKDMLTGRNELEEKDYQRIYNTPYSWRLDMDKIGETDGGEAGYLYPQFDSKVGKLGLFNRQVDEDGRVCYQIKNDKGQLVTRCSETANLINRALGLPTTDDAWKRYGVYGDSLIYGQPDHNKFYTRPIGKVINGLRPDLLDPNNLKTGDFVDLYTEGSGHNAEAATGRGNSHTGTIYRPQGDKGPVYIIHGGINERAYVDPLAQFGPTHTWSIMSVRRPGSKEHPYYED